jgi:hypothetical protein
MVWVKKSILHFSLILVVLGLFYGNTVSFSF